MENLGLTDIYLIYMNISLNTNQIQRQDQSHPENTPWLPAGHWSRRWPCGFLDTVEEPYLFLHSMQTINWPKAFSDGDTGDSNEAGDPSWLALDPESSALSTMTLGLLKQALQQRSFFPPGFVTM